MKNITITGPRSVGKSTISKIVAKKLKLKYISSDEIGEKALKKQGGLDKATKSGLIAKTLRTKGYNLVKNVYNSENNYIFDLSGGAFASNKIPLASLEVRQIAKEKSIIVGLLPSKSFIYSIWFLFKREIKRAHFKDMNKLVVLKNVIKSYINFPRVFNSWADLIIYTQNKNPEEVAFEIISKLKCLIN